MIGLIWLAYAFLFPLYRLSDYVIVIILSFIIYLSVSGIINRFFIKEEYKAVDTGDAYIDELLISALDNLTRMKALRHAIQNDGVKNQIESLENDSYQLIGYIKRYPDKYTKVSQFFLYYLPSTLKLINNYQELEGIGQVGENHSSGMKKTEKFLTELVGVYHKVLDDLLKDKVMEASVDMDVMEEMLQKDKYLSE